MIIALFLWACTPTCEKTCKKILTCDELESPEMNQDECESSCNAQANLYEDVDDEDETLQTAFDDLKSCIVDEACFDLSEGVCYDEDIFAW
jgi:hypothetical protein